MTMVDAVDFNPRSREGSDEEVTFDDGEAAGFSPRSREGRGVTGVNKARNAKISIHAPAKGATTQRPGH